MKTPRVVLDTNVLVSGLCFGGLPAKVIQLAFTGELELFTSAFLIDEFQDVIKLKFPRRQEAVMDTLAELGVMWEMVETQGHPRLRVIADDPDDDRVLECAIAAGADCIVSGDKHLLDLGSFRGIAILSPRAFFQRFG